MPITTGDQWDQRSMKISKISAALAIALAVSACSEQHESNNKVAE